MIGALFALAAPLAGCHTIDAVRRLAAPSPAYEIAVSGAADPEDIRYRARYGVAPPIDVIVPIVEFHHNTSQSGQWRAAGARAACAQAASVPERIRADRPIVFESRYLYPFEVTENQLHRAQGMGCTHLLVAEIGDYPRIAALVLHPVQGGEPVRLVPAEEQPLREPSRWGWLVISPALDTVALVGNVVVLGIYFAALPFL